MVVEPDPPAAGTIPCPFTEDGPLPIPPPTPPTDTLGEVMVCGDLGDDGMLEPALLLVLLPQSPCIQLDRLGKCFDVKTVTDHITSASRIA